MDYSARWCWKYITQIAQGAQIAQGEHQQQDIAQAMWHSCLLRCTDDHLTLTYGGRFADQLISS